LLERGIRGVQGRLGLPFFRFFDSLRFSDVCVQACRGFNLLYERDGTISYGGLIAAKRMGIPLIVEVNGDLVEEWKQLGWQMSAGQRAAVHFVTRQFYHRAHHIVAVGETIKRRLVERWALDPHKISVVTNGVDLDLFVRTPPQSDTRARFGIGAGPLVAFTGSFQPWHGVELILEAFERLAGRVPDAQMVFVGDGGLRAALEGRARTAGLGSRIVFTGRVPHEEVARVLAIADVAVIYHRGEAAEIVETPLKLFEYLAAGKAVVAPAVPNMARVLTDRVNARLVPPDNPPALAAAVEELLRDEGLRLKLGRAARSEAQSKHSWDRAVSELEEVFDRVLTNTGAVRP
jgi:glycosyltransferase involved in cell wall biosynthesis